MNSGIPYLNLLALNRGNGGDAPKTEEPGSIDEKPSDTQAAVVKEKHSDESIHSVEAGTSTPPRIPRPSQYFAHFVDHRSYFIRFLEAVAENRWSQSVRPDSNPSKKKSKVGGRGGPSSSDEKDEQMAIWNTLLELYLSAALDSSGGGGAETEEEVQMKGRAMYVLSNEETLPYDPTHALIVCSTHSFTDGLVLLWEKMGMYEEVLRFWMDRELHPDVSPSFAPPSSSSSEVSASTRVIQCLELYGPQHPHLYALVLRFLSSSPALLSKHTADLKKLLNVVHDEGYVSTLQVVQILSRNEVASVGLVKEWLMERIAEGREGVEAVRVPFPRCRLISKLIFFLQL